MHLAINMIPIPKCPSLLIHNPNVATIQKIKNIIINLTYQKKEKDINEIKAPLINLVEAGQKKRDNLNLPKRVVPTLHQVKVRKLLHAPKHQTLIEETLLKTEKNKIHDKIEVLVAHEILIMQQRMRTRDNYKRVLKVEGMEVKNK